MNLVNYELICFNYNYGLRILENIFSLFIWPGFSILPNICVDLHFIIIPQVPYPLGNQWSLKWSIHRCHIRWQRFKNVWISCQPWLLKMLLSEQKHTGILLKIHGTYDRLLSYVEFGISHQIIWTISIIDDFLLLLMLSVRQASADDSSKM